MCYVFKMLTINVLFLHRQHICEIFMITRCHCNFTLSSPAEPLWFLGSSELTLKSFWRIYQWSEERPAAVLMGVFLGWEGRAGLALGFGWFYGQFLGCGRVNNAKSGDFGAGHSLMCSKTCVCRTVSPQAVCGSWGWHVYQGTQQPQISV